MAYKQPKVGAQTKKSKNRQKSCCSASESWLIHDSSLLNVSKYFREVLGFIHWLAL